ILNYGLLGSSLLDNISLRSFTRRTSPGYNRSLMLRIPTVLRIPTGLDPQGTLGIHA
ncbi:Hypothetical protein FKW44_005986, partial [Caligus rogercresseyi]